jgi:aminomethyltransferase
MNNLKKTPLHSCHTALKARMVPFGGWDMPVQYTGVLQEHETVRAKVGLFDVSHMGEFFVRGKDATSFLNRVTTNDIGKMVDGRCQYTLLCYENGTVVDDLIVSRLKDDDYLLVVNASNIDKDFQWLKSQLRGDVVLTNASDDWVLLAIQGPQAPSVVSTLFGPRCLDVKYYHFIQDQYQNQKVSVSRTGYTGEDGFEVFVPASLGVAAWQEILRAGQGFGIQPIGLAARDTLRLEAAFPLYGHEINDQTLALEAGLGWVVKFDKGDFIGKAALQAAQQAGLKRKLVGFEMVDSAIARDGFAIYDNDQKIGHVTSGTFAPSLKKSIGLALIETNSASVDRTIFLEIRGQKKKAKTVKTPFYQRLKKN